MLAGAAITGAALARTRAARLLPLLAVAAIGVLALVAFTPIAPALVRPLVRRDPLPEEPLDAVVVLSAGLSDDGHLNQQGLDRLLTGMELVRRGAAPRLVLSRVRNRGVPSDGDQQRVLALRGGATPVVVVDSVFGTRDEAVKVAALGSAARRIALVTSPAHTRRACATFERVGFRVTCVPAESRDLPLGALDRPTSRVLAFRLWLYESLAAALYRARGWIP